MKRLDRHQRIAVVILAAIAATCGAALHASSYKWSVSLTVLDLRLVTDEGLIGVQVPLTRLAPGESPQTEHLVYGTGPNGMKWFSGDRGRTPFRAFLSFDEIDAPLFADFGYWKGAWQSDARPGPFVYLFAPAWFVAFMGFGVSLAVYYRKVRFGIRTLLVLMALCGVMV
jgi:hypothetical protein